MVLLVRLLHGSITVFFLWCIGYIYYAAFTRRRGPLLEVVIGAVVVEGAVVGLNGGECPLGGVHRRYGDERTFFELFVPKRYARHAVPFFAAVTVLGILLALARGKARPPRAPRPAQ